MLTTAGHTVRVYCPTVNLPASETRIFTQNRDPVKRFGAHKRVDDTLVDWFEMIVEDHKNQPFDLIHAYFLTQAGFVAAYTGKYLGLQSVVSIRGNDIERAVFDPAKFSHILYALQNAAAVTANASILVKKAQALVDREIAWIPNGVDVTRFRPMERNSSLAEALGLEEEKIIGFAGELREKKGLTTLLRAYAQIVETHSAVLLIVGDIRPGEDQKIFDEIKSSIPHAKIVVTGYVSNHDLPSYYLLMDAIVHPSLRDGLPNVLLEAMACGKPVIATPVGGVMDVLDDCRNGRLVPINDVHSLSTVIQEVLSDKIMQENLGNAARRTIQDRYTLQNELDGNLNVYRKLGIIKYETFTHFLLISSYIKQLYYLNYR